MSQFNVLPDIVPNSAIYNIGDMEIVVYELSAVSTAKILNKYMNFLKTALETDLTGKNEGAAEATYLKTLSEDIDTYYDLVAYGTKTPRNELISALNKKITMPQLLELALKVVEVNKANFLSSMNLLPQVYMSLNTSATAEQKPVKRKAKVKAKARAGRA